jgi:hypothetical protein
VSGKSFGVGLVAATKTIPMNQDTVNKIVVPEPGSQIADEGFQFAIVEDCKSLALVKSRQC